MAKSWPKTNLDLIRQQAMDKLGLQDPAGSRLVQVVIPQSDRIILLSLLRAPLKMKLFWPAFIAPWKVILRFESAREGQVI